MPSLSDFINASNLVYNHSSAPPTGLTPLMVNGQAVTSEVDSDGFYGAAFVNSSGQVIIAYEGTTPNLSAYGIGTLEADGAILSNQTPAAFGDAQNFANTVIQAAAGQGISTDNIFVTGHSRGGAEAESVAANLGLGGATFGAPGVPQFTTSGGNSNLTDYVDYGDPVGNFASDTVSGAQLAGPNMDHVGNVVMVGNIANQQGLLDAGYALNNDTDGSAGPYVLGILAGQLGDHMLGNYANDLNSPLQSLSPASATTDQLDPYNLLEGIDLPMGSAGQQDLSQASIVNGDEVTSPDFTITLNSDGSLTVTENQPLSNGSLSSTDGTTTFNVNPSALDVTSGTFVESGGPTYVDTETYNSNGVLVSSTLTNPDGSYAVSSFDTNGSGNYSVTSYDSSGNETGQDYYNASGQPIPSPNPGPEPHAGPKSNPSTEPDARTEPDPGTQPDAGSKSNARSEPDAGSEPNPSTEPDPGPQPDAGPESNAGSEPNPSTEPNPGSKPNPSSQPRARPHTGTGAHTRARANPNPRACSGAGADANTGSEPGRVIRLLRRGRRRWSPPEDRQHQSPILDCRIFNQRNCKRSWRSNSGQCRSARHGHGSGVGVIADHVERAGVCLSFADPAPAGGSPHARRTDRTSPAQAVTRIARMATTPPDTRPSHGPGACGHRCRQPAFPRARWHVRQRDLGRSRPGRRAPDGAAGRSRAPSGDRLVHRQRQLEPGAVTGSGGQRKPTLSAGHGGHA
jgi:hypothetical protein